LGNQYALHDGGALQGHTETLALVAYSVVSHLPVREAFALAEANNYLCGTA
jgi:hypothetical protein